MVELYSQALAQHGQPALPTYVEPPLSPRSRPDLVAEYPLVLTCAKSPRYCKLNAGLDRGVVCAQHGWWQGCDELDLPPSDPYELDGVNLNLVLRQTPSDPISGSSPLRASLCNVARV